MPLISIVIPVYNGEKFLRETLTSIKNQTFSDFECVIVNDGSTDSSQIIINEFLIDDIRFKCFVISNSGCADIPIKHGVKNSSSNLTMVIGHDDYLDSKCLEKMYQRQLETNADIVLLRLIGCLVELEGELYRLPYPGFEEDKLYTGNEACALTIGGWKIGCNGMLVKKSLYEGVPIGSYMNSDELSSRYLLYKANNVVFSDATYYYRNHLNSISRAISSRLFEKLIVDSQLDEFINAHYSEESEIPKQMRNARFFNLIYFQTEFVKYANFFTKSQQKKIKEIIIESYKTQNFIKLRKELPKHFIFLHSYQLFKINSSIYSLFKRAKGNNYLLK
jgi:glycosyltransferase involved in cell wall biosynthesis